MIGISGEPVGGAGFCAQITPQLPTAHKSSRTGNLFIRCRVHGTGGEGKCPRHYGEMLGPRDQWSGTRDQGLGRSVVVSHSCANCAHEWGTRDGAFLAGSRRVFVFFTFDGDAKRAEKVYVVLRKAIAISGFRWCVGIGFLV